MNEVRFQSGAFLPPCVGGAVLQDGKQVDIRKKIEINQAGQSMTTYELWRPYESNQDSYRMFPPRDEDPYEVCGRVWLTETRYDRCKEYLPLSFANKTLTWVNSMKSWQKGGGSVLMKVAELHSKHQGHEGLLILRSINDSAGFYKKMGLVSLHPEAICPEMYLPIEKVTQVAEGRFRSITPYEALFTPKPDLVQEQVLPYRSLRQVIVEWVTAFFHQIFHCIEY